MFFVFFVEVTICPAEEKIFTLDTSATFMIEIKSDDGLGAIFITVAEFWDVEVASDVFVVKLSCWLIHCAYNARASAGL